MLATEAIPSPWKILILKERKNSYCIRVVKWIGFSPFHIFSSVVSDVFSGEGNAPPWEALGCSRTDPKSKDVPYLRPWKELSLPLAIWMRWTENLLLGRCGVRAIIRGSFCSCSTQPLFSECLLLKVGTRAMDINTHMIISATINTGGNPQETRMIGKARGSLDEASRTCQWFIFPRFCLMVDVYCRTEVSKWEETKFWPRAVKSEQQAEDEGWGVTAQRKAQTWTSWRQTRRHPDPAKPIPVPVLSSRWHAAMGLPPGAKLLQTPWSTELPGSLGAMWELTPAWHRLSAGAKQALPPQSLGTHARWVTGPHVSPYHNGQGSGWINPGSPKPASAGGGSPGRWSWCWSRSRSSWRSLGRPMPSCLHLREAAC